MRNRDQALAELFAKLKEMHGDRFKPSKLIFAIWDQALEGCTGPQIDAAFMAYIRSEDSNYAPASPAVLLKHISNNRDAAEGAFLVLRSALRGTNSRDGVAFGDPLIHRTLQQLGGWVDSYFFLLDREKIDTFHERFVKTYERLAKGPALPHPAYLPGAANNIQYWPVGDAEQVDAVVQSGYDPNKPMTSNYLQPSGQLKQLLPAATY